MMVKFLEILLVTICGALELMKKEQVYFPASDSLALLIV